MGKKSEEPQSYIDLLKQVFDDENPPDAESGRAGIAVALAAIADELARFNDREESYEEEYQSLVDAYEDEAEDEDEDRKEPN